MVNDKENMENILKDYEIDIVVSAVGPRDSLDQLILVEAMKSIKTIKVSFLSPTLFSSIN